MNQTRWFKNLKVYNGERIQTIFPSHCSSLTLLFLFFFCSTIILFLFNSPSKLLQKNLLIPFPKPVNLIVVHGHSSCYELMPCYYFSAPLMYFALVSYMTLIVHTVRTTLPSSLHKKHSIR